MFYPIHLLCGKRGRLGIVWIAGTAGFNHSTASFLNKRELLSVNIQMACREVVAPNQPMALRLAAILMLGIARIYKRQTKFLLVEVEDMYKDLKKHHSFSIDLVDSTNNKGSNLILTNCVGEVESFETDRLLTGVLSNLNLISYSSYTAYENSPIVSVDSIVMQSASDNSIALPPSRSIMLDTNNLTLDRRENDDLGGPFNLSFADNSFGQVRDSFNSDIDLPNGNISPMHYTATSPVPSNRNVRQAFSQCVLGAIDEELERPPKRQKKKNKLAIDYVTSMNNSQLRKNLDSETDIIKTTNSVWPKKQLRHHVTRLDSYLLANRHVTSLYHNPEWSELESIILPNTHRDETISSTNFSRLLESSTSHTTSIIRNTSNLSVNGLQADYSLENIEVNPMQIEEDLSLVPDAPIPCPSPQLPEVEDSSYQSFQLMNGSESFERRSIYSFQTEQILETFNELKQTARRPFIFLKDLFPSLRPNRKQVVKIFYSILKHAHTFHPEQRGAYEEILLRYD
ncbi:Serine/arginine repetitive matrix protein 1-like [Oopsacas minuta]|uniref:Serine/arginine repetitive matrix protein 1-like n=1 Tax=Oopsacas minuta TaxID=111878 RepID=A0AAV7JUT0_9METZ|nr:Serine/arginine repetitive matrix protein 1-like [Oopsacas minuta]